MIAREASSPLLPALVDLALEARYSSEAPRSIAGDALWRASRLGYCLAQQMLLARGVEAPERVEARTRRIFEVGHMTGEWIGRRFDELGILIEEERPIVSAEYNLGGHADFIIGGKPNVGVTSTAAPAWIRDLQAKVLAYYPEGVPITGVELKSMNSKVFWYAAKAGTGVVAKDHQLIQAAAYDVLTAGTEIESWAVLSISKDDLSMAQDPVLQVHRDEVLRRLNVLNEHYAAGTMPPCSCFQDWNGNSWRWCSFYRGEDEKRKQRSAGDSCCDVSWLEVAHA